MTICKILELFFALFTFRHFCSETFIWNYILKLQVCFHFLFSLLTCFALSDSFIRKRYIDALDVVFTESENVRCVDYIEFCSLPFFGGGGRKCLKDSEWIAMALYRHSWSHSHYKYTHTSAWL